jgi:hypothetical protein
MAKSVCAELVEARSFFLLGKGGKEERHFDKLSANGV